MKKIVGFALFFVAIGMGIMMCITNRVMGTILIISFIVVGYHLFCNCK